MKLRKVNGDIMYQKCVDLICERGVTIQDIADCVMFLQKKYLPELTNKHCLAAIDTVLHKREVQHAILTGIYLDRAAENQSMDDLDLRDILMNDSALYGIDEVLAYGICNLYGSIALTNYGYIDKIKPGIIEVLNRKGEQCNTFLDDIVGAIAAAAASKIAHNINK
ncbi:MAG: phosphatidylglycerophosphatase A [Erysipelotrichaceae bacterium]